jgi:hypothetical protein
MRLRWIIVAGAVGLGVAWWEASLVAVYIAMIGCMILYGLRVISLQLDERDDALDLDDQE